MQYLLLYFLYNLYNALVYRSVRFRKNGDVMADAKIDIKVGAVSFAAEGSEKWLSGELDKVLAKAAELAAIVPTQNGSNDGGNMKHTIGGGSTSTAKLKGTLAGFLKERRATTNQVRKFLATATWLQDHDGKERLTTKEITNALSDAKQTALTNPSQCLAHNVKQGFCQKDGKKQFYVTPEGIDDVVGRAQEE